MLVGRRQTLLTLPWVTTASTAWGRSCRRSTPGRHWGGRGGGRGGEKAGGVCDGRGREPRLLEGERACPGWARRPPATPPPRVRLSRLPAHASLLFSRVCRRRGRPRFRHIDIEFAGHIEIGRGAAAGIALDDAAVGSGQRGGLDGKLPGRALKSKAITGRGGGRRGRCQAGPARRLDGGGLGAARTVVGDTAIHAGRALGRAGGEGEEEERGRGREKWACEILWFG